MLKALLLASASVVTFTCASTIAQAENPLLNGVGHVKVNTVADNKQVVGKGATADYYGYYGNYYNAMAGAAGAWGYLKGTDYWKSAYDNAVQSETYYYYAYIYSAAGY
jgi:hypothetical protein